MWIFYVTFITRVASTVFQHLFLGCWRANNSTGTRRLPPSLSLLNLLKWKAEITTSQYTIGNVVIVVFSLLDKTGWTLRYLFLMASFIWLTIALPASRFNQVNIRKVDGTHMHNTIESWFSRQLTIDFLSVNESFFLIEATMWTVEKSDVDPGANGFSVQHVWPRL